MNSRSFRLTASIAVVFFAMFILSANCSSSYDQGLTSRPEGGLRRGKTAQGNLRERYRQLLQEMKNKGHDVSEAEALNEKARLAMKAGNRREARMLLTKAIAKLESLKNASTQTPKYTETSEKPSGEKKTLSIPVNAVKVRVIETFPSNTVDISDNTLQNFNVSELEAKEGQAVVNINFPAIIEEYPYSDMALKHNKAFGSTESGLVRLHRQDVSVSKLNTNLKQIFKMLSQAGVGLARDFQSYDTLRIELEAEKGKYDFSKSDFAVEAAMTSKLDFVGRLGLHYGRIGKEGPPKDETAYVAYIKKTVKRYKNRIKIWQTLKEPNPERRNRPGNDAGLSPRNVVRILELSYTTIKSIDPNARVYFPGLGAPIRKGKYTDESYLDEIIALGGAKYFDVIGFDAYVWDIEEEMRKYKRILKKYGYDKPIWVAQTGVPAGQVSIPIKFKGGGSDRTQVEFMVKTYARAFALGVEKVFWGEFIDKSKAEEKNRDAFTNAWNQTGLFYTGTWKAKPAYFTHRLLATALNDFTEAKAVAPNIVKFTFADRSPFYLVWPK